MTDVPTTVGALWEAWLPTARWFGAKGLGFRVCGVKVLPPYVDQPGMVIRSELIDVDVAEPAGTVRQQYHVIAGYVEPTSAPEGLIGRALFAGRPHDVVDALVCPATRDAFVRQQCPDLPADAPARLLAFSSNTLVAAGDVVLKIARRLPGGLLAEAEALAALKDAGIAPRLLWAIAAEEQVLGIALERLDATDGWELAVASARAGRPFAEEARALGRTLRALHERFARAFATSVHQVTFDADLDAACAQVPALAALRPALATILRAPASPVPVQRVHGDFHLQQTMRTTDGWRVIDFEGEPLRADRDLLDSPLRDVAGAIRSFDYARAQAAAPAGWRDDAIAAFLDGYGTIDDPKLLRAYIVGKALYETVYETRNRPEWVHIPLRAVEDEARRAEPGPAATRQEYS